MNRQLLFKVVSALMIAWAFSSCQSSKQLAYFQDLSDTTKAYNVVSQYPYKPIKLQVDDEVQVIVTSTSPEASAFFNITATSLSANSAVLNAYRVTPLGYITMPVIGDMQVQGLTTQEVKLMVLEKLKPYLKDAVVSVRLLNFKVTVIGEVRAPLVVPVTTERINVLEAIGAAGDMTTFSKRSTVKVIRRAPDSTLLVGRLNFNTSKMMESPFFQLQQNDVVYIEPSPAKGISSERSTLILPLAATFASLVIALVTFLTR